MAAAASGGWMKALGQRRGVWSQGDPGRWVGVAVVGALILLFIYTHMYSTGPGGRRQGARAGERDTSLRGTTLGHRQGGAETGNGEEAAYP